MMGICEVEVDSGVDVLWGEEKVGDGPSKRDSE
jgi:hypothetical protein